MIDFTCTDYFIKLLIFGQGIVYKGTIFISCSYWYWIGSMSSKPGKNFRITSLGKKVM